MKTHLMDRRDARMRRGSSLIELMITMPMLATLLVFAIGWIHQSMNLASTMRERGRDQQQWLALARQFRDDVHRANAARFDGQASLVVTFADASEVTYELSQRRITRRRAVPQGDDSQREDRADRRERYELRDGIRAHWKRSEMPDWATLVIERAGHELGAARPASKEFPLHEPRPITLLHVRAAVGRLQRMRVTTADGSASASDSQPNSDSPAETDVPAESDSSSKEAS